MERSYGLKFVRDYAVWKVLPLHLWLAGWDAWLTLCKLLKDREWKDFLHGELPLEPMHSGKPRSQRKGLLQLLLGCDFFYLHFKHSLWPWEMNHSPVSNAGFTLQTEDMRYFQPFLGRKRGHTLNSHRVFPSLPSVGRNAPGKACASSIGPGPTLVPCPEETWKYGQLYLKSQTSKSLCFTPKRKEWCLDFSERLISSQQHGFYLWFIYFCNIQCGKTYGEC